MEENNTNKMLVVPDVHGRSFWKDVLSFEGDIIFLGDYHDPYPREFADMRINGNKVSPTKISLANLKEIFAFAQDNPERVTLLIGNHDMAYIEVSYNASRKDNNNRFELYRLYEENRHLLHGCKIVGNTIFTHAGISQQWYDMMLSEHPQLVPQEIEFNVNLVIDRAESCVLNCSPYRGGTLEYSGPLWQDSDELLSGYCNILKTDKYQIFAHTYQHYEGRITAGEGWAMIDSRRVFEVDPYNPEQTLKLYQPNKAQE